MPRRSSGGCHGMLKINAKAMTVLVEVEMMMVEADGVRGDGVKGHGVGHPRRSEGDAAR